MVADLVAHRVRVHGQARGVRVGGEGGRADDGVLTGKADTGLPAREDFRRG